MEEYVKTTLRLERTLHKRFKAACVERESTIEKAISEGIEWWMGPGDVVASTPAVVSGTRESAQLANFLQTGDPGQVKIVRMILEEHAKSQKASRKRNSA